MHLAPDQRKSRAQLQQKLLHMPHQAFLERPLIDVLAQGEKVKKVRIF
jgi:hypothetical protein